MPVLIGPDMCLRRLPVINNTAEDCPVYGACEISRPDENGVYQLRKPDKDDSGTAYINTESVIKANGGRGYVCRQTPTWALYHAADGDPDNRESIGTRSGFWELHRGYEGFIVIGGADGTKVYVERDVTCRDLVSGGYYGYYPAGRPASNPSDCPSCPGGIGPSQIIVDVLFSGSCSGNYTIDEHATGTFLSFSCTSAGIVEPVCLPPTAPSSHRSKIQSVVEEHSCFSNVTITYTHVGGNVFVPDVSTLHGCKLHFYGKMCNSLGVPESYDFTAETILTVENITLNAGCTSATIAFTGSIIYTPATITLMFATFTVPTDFCVSICSENYSKTITGSPLCIGSASPFPTAPLFTCDCHMASIAWRLA